MTDLPAIRARLAAYPDDVDGYEGHGCERDARFAHVDRIADRVYVGTRERDVLADLRAVLAELDAERAAADALAEAVEGLDGHTEHCAMMQPYRGCTCGYEEAEAALAAYRAARGA